MKTTTDKLFRLIKAMTPAEKRYFKVHYGSDKNTLTQLFDIINLQSTYNEIAIKEVLADKAATNLKVYKFQLEQLILKSLMSHQHSSRLESKIRSGLAHFDILLEKKLLDMAQKQLEKTRKLCLKANYLSYYPVLLEKEMKLRYLLGEGFYSVNLDSLSKPQESILYLLSTQNHLHQLYYLIHLYLEQTLPLSRLTLEKEQLQSTSEYSESSTPTQITILERMTQMLKWTLLGLHEQVLEEAETLLPAFQQNYLHQLPVIYLFGLRCALDASFARQDWEAFSLYLDQGLKHSIKQPGLANHYYYFAAYEIRYLLKADKSSSDLSKMIKQHQKQADQSELGPSLPQALYLAWGSIAHLAHQDYKSALAKLYLLLQFPQETVSFGPAIGQLLQLILAFEKGGDTQLKEVLQQIKTRNTLSLPRNEKRLYSSFLRFMGQVAQTPAEAAGLAKDLLQEINSQEPSLFHRAFRQLFLDKWLQSTIKGEPFIRQLQS